MCQYLHGNRAAEILDYDLTSAGMKPSKWTDWTEYDCTHPAAEEEGCPYLDDNDVECPIKENHIWNLHHWAIQELAGDRQDKYTRVRELMQEAEI